MKAISAIPSSCAHHPAGGLLASWVHWWSCRSLPGCWLPLQKRCNPGRGMACRQRLCKPGAAQVKIWCLSAAGSYPVLCRWITFLPRYKTGRRCWFFGLPSRAAASALLWNRYGRNSAGFAISPPPMPSIPSAVAFLLIGSPPWIMKSGNDAMKHQAVVKFWLTSLTKLSRQGWNHIIWRWWYWSR